MSSLTTTTINTIDNITPLTLATGNTAGPSVIVSSGTDVTVKANATSTVFIANSTAIRANATMTVANSLTVSSALTVSGQTTLNAVADGANFAGNTTLANVVATTITTTNATISTNTLTLGISSASSTNGYSRLVNGLLMQWGSVASVGTGGASVTFPVAFAVAPYSIVVTSKAATPATGAAQSPTTTGFTIDSSATSDYYYLAIGR